MPLEKFPILSAISTEVPNYFLYVIIKDSLEFFRNFISLTNVFLFSYVSLYNTIDNDVFILRVLYIRHLILPERRVFLKKGEK